MDVRVRRLAIRCQAPAAGSARAAAVRTRLARVAAGPLGAALDDLLGPLAGDATVDRLVVPLDLDPDDYDDETLAVLWAGRIAAELASAVAPAAGAGPDGTGGDATAAPPPPSDGAPPAAAVAEWVRAFTALPAGEVAAVAAGLVALPGVPARLYVLLDASGRAAVLAALAAAARLASPAPDGAAPRRGGDVVAPAPRTGGGSAPAGWNAAWEAAAAAHATPARGAAARPRHPVAVAAARLAEPPPVPRHHGAAARRLPSPRRADRVPRSSAGGLVLLYPWLAAYLGDAVTAEPDAVPEDVRRVALAALAGPDEPLLQHDPLVKVLAGLRVDAATPDLPVAERAEADDVLRAFAGMLRGFEGSTPGYVRAHLLRRDADVVPLGEFTHVRLGARPLDLLLRQLPYPLGVFRLPWTEPLAVELGGR